MRKIIKTIAFATTALILSVSANAQDDDGGPVSQGDDARYLSITHVAFKQGKRESAMQIIGEHFIPAGEKAGVPGPVSVIHYQTGSWDAAFIWEMEGGMADLEWYRSPNDVKWFAALAELSGGEEEAGKIWEKYISSVARAVTQVGHDHEGGDE